MTRFTDADLERATNWLEVDSDDDDIPLHNELAQLIADIRNETIERCAVEVEHLASMGGRERYVLAAELIRALKDGGK